MYTKVILCHASSYENQMVTGVSAGSGSQGRPVCDEAEVNFLQKQHFILTVQQTLDKPHAILKQSNKPPKLIYKLYQGLIEAFPSYTKHLKQKCDEDPDRSY